MFKLLINRNFLFGVALVTGLIVGNGTAGLSFINMPILMFIMTVSFTETDFSALKNIKKAISPFAAGIFLNYLLTFFIIIILGRLFSFRETVWAGVVLTAATPPGLAIIPFTAMMGGDLFYAATATLSAFGATLFLMPWFSSIFTGGKGVEFFEIFNLLILLVIIPLIIGRIFRALKLKNIAMKIHGPVTNIGFAVIFAVIFGLNREFIFDNPGDVLKLLILFIIVVFGLAFGMKYLVKRKRIAKETKISIVTVATIKNTVFGAAAGLSLLGPEGAIGGTVMSFVTLAYLAIIDKILKDL